MLHIHVYIFMFRVLRKNSVPEENRKKMHERPSTKLIRSKIMFMST